LSQTRPKFITFDCYGTLTWFRMGETAREIFADRLNGERMDRFLADFSAYRRDEVLGAWKPYADVIKNGLARACRKHGLPVVEAEGQRIYDAIPSWGPHPDVPEPLTRIGKQIPLVILSNAMDDQIGSNVAKLEAPFHAVYTAQQAQSYKPRMQGFEYMFDQLNCNPEDVLHVSSSLRYDLMTAHDMGIKHKAFVKRGHEPGTPYYEYYEVDTIGDLATQLGL